MDPNNLLYCWLSYDIQYNSKQPFVWIRTWANWFYPNLPPRHFDSFYLPSDSGTHYLSNVTGKYNGDTLEIKIIDPYTNTTFSEPAYDEGELVTLNGTLLKQYVPPRCYGSPDFNDLYKSAYLLVDSNQIPDFSK